MSIEVYAGNISYSSEFKIDRPPYKQWDDLNALKSKENMAYCIKRGSIATRSGTYNTPAPLTLTDFNINLNQGAKVKKVVLHYSQQKFSLSRSQGASTFPIFAGATFTLLGTGKSLVGEAVTSKYTSHTLEFTGITREQLMGNGFGVKIAYPRNNSTNTGRMALGNVFLEIITEEPTVLLSIGTQKNNLVVNDICTVELSVEQINSSEYNPVIDISIPEGLTLQSNDGHGILQATSETGVYRWSSSFDDNRSVNKKTINLLCTTKGTYDVSMIDTATNISKTLKINVIEYEYTVETDPAPDNMPLVQGNPYGYYVTVRTNNTETTTHTFKILLPPNTTIGTALTENRHTVSTQSGTGNTLITLSNISIDKNNPLVFRFNTTFQIVGYAFQKVYIDNKLMDTKEFIVQASSYESLGFTRLLIPEDYTESMGHNINYTFSTIARYVLKDVVNNLRDWKNNLRVGIYNSTITDVSDEDDFLSHVVWCEGMGTVKWSEYTCRFTYNSSNPLYLVFSHDYVGNPLYENLSYEFTQPTLIETEYVGYYDDNKPYPVPIGALLNNNEFAVVKLGKQTDTAPVLCYDFEGTDAFRLTDISVRGITLNLQYVTSETVELQITVSADGYDNIKGYRNKTLQAGAGTLTLGGKFDLFGLRPHDLRGKASELTVEIVVNNPYDTEAIVELSDVNLTLNYHEISESIYGFTLDGERSEEYGLYFYDMETNLGTKNEIEEYSITGSDKSIVNRMNIKPKNITIELAIDECDLADELEQAQDVITKLFTNKRNVLTNKPIEKSIIFDYLPEDRYWFVRKDEIKDKIDKGTYYMTIELYVPRGTSEIIPKVITGSSNATNGLLSIEPLIHLKTTSMGGVEVLEENTGQTVLVNDATIKLGDIITIDNENRRVTRLTPGDSTEEDITSNVDFSTTWFRIRGEYKFTSPNSIITDIEYYDRR